MPGESKRKGRQIRGFSLVESLISLALFSLFILAGLEFFASSRTIFLRLKEDYQRFESAFCALDKLR